ncbi:hypothetical protein TorRG33x02_082400, partial [Trema orientale]
NGAKSIATCTIQVLNLNSILGYNYFNQITSTHNRGSRKQRLATKNLAKLIRTELFENNVSSPKTKRESESIRPRHQLFKGKRTTEQIVCSFPIQPQKRVMGFSSYTKRRINKLITMKFLSIPLFSQQPNRLKAVQNTTQYNNPTIHTNLTTILKVPHQPKSILLG